MSDALHPLSDELAHPAPQQHRVARWKLWAGLLLAPLAFSLEVLASYSIGSELCSAGRMPLPWLAGLLVAMTVLAAVGGAIAWSNWRKTRGEAPGDIHASADRGDGRTRFMSLFALIWSALFLLGVAVQALVLLWFGPCVGLATLD